MCKRRMCESNCQVQQEYKAAKALKGKGNGIALSGHTCRKERSFRMPSKPHEMSNTMFWQLHAFIAPSLLSQARTSCAIAAPTNAASCPAPGRGSTRFETEAYQFTGGNALPRTNRLWMLKLGLESLVGIQPCRPQKDWNSKDSTAETHPHDIYVPHP